MDHSKVSFQCLSPTLSAPAYLACFMYLHDASTTYKIDGHQTLSLTTRNKKRFNPYQHATQAPHQNILMEVMGSLNVEVDWHGRGAHGGVARFPDGAQEELFEVVALLHDALS